MKSVILQEGRKTGIMHKVMDSILLIQKPAGITSFDAVRRCRNIFHEKKAGHTGTLDPQASGLMIILLGKYTKLAPYCACDHKHYLTEFRLGTKYSTGDVFGEPLDRKAPADHSIDELNEAARSLTGKIIQIPPMYSAVHVGGHKLYEYARKGKEVERPGRLVTVNSLSIGKKDEETWTMDAIVSSGTYIRTLIEDLGNLIGEFAAMSALQRTGIEGLSLSDANTFEQLETDPVYAEPYQVLKPSLPLVSIQDPESVLHGRPLKLDREENEVIIIDGSKKILAAYQKRDDGLYHCERGLF